MIEPLTFAQATYIARRMRDQDRHEVLATLPHTDLRLWAGTIIKHPGEQICVSDRDQIPVMMGGVIPMWPGLAQTWMVATPAITKVGWLVHAAAVKMHRRWAALGIRRFQTYAMETSPSIVWLREIGYQREGVHRGFGRDGETFVTMGRVLNE